MTWLRPVKQLIAGRNAVKRIAGRETRCQQIEDIRWHTAEVYGHRVHDDFEPILPGEVVSIPMQWEEAVPEMDDVSVCQELWYTEDSTVPVPATREKRGAEGLSREVRSVRSYPPRSAPLPDGLWKLAPGSKDAPSLEVPPWLARLEIRGDGCIDGEGCTRRLKQRQGCIVLAGGVVTFDGAHLHRIGEDGVRLTFAWAGRGGRARVPAELPSLW